MKVCLWLTVALGVTLIGSCRWKDTGPWIAHVYGNNEGTVATWRRDRGEIFVGTVLLNGIHFLSTLTFWSWLFLECWPSTSYLFIYLDILLLWCLQIWATNSLLRLFFLFQLSAHSMLNMYIYQLLSPTCFGVGCAVFKQTIPWFGDLLKNFVLQPCKSSKWLHTVSNNSVRGWWKSFINTSTYMLQVSRLCTNFIGVCFVLSCGNNLLRNPRTELWRPWVMVKYKNLPPRNEVAGIRLVGMRELLQLRRKLPVTAFHLLALRGTKRT